MPHEKTDPFGPIPRNVAGAAALALLLIGPAGGFVGARYVAPDDDRDDKIVALELRVERLSSDVSRLADTLGDVRKIEEAAHPRVGVPRSNPDNQ